MILSSIPRRRTDYRLEQIDGELLLFHPNQTKILYFNQTASLIWQLCDGLRTSQEIAALLSAAFPEAAGNMAVEVEATLQQFCRQGVIDYEGGADASPHRRKPG